VDVPNIFALGQDAYQQSYGQQQKQMQDRASIQAGRAIGQGDFTGASQAFGGAGMTQDATQAFQNNQAQQTRQARVAAATAYGQGDAKGAVAALAPTGDIQTQAAIQDDAVKQQQAQQQKQQDTVLRVAQGLKTVPAGSRMAALQAALPVFQSVGISPSAFANASEDQLADPHLDQIISTLGKAKEDYNLGTVRYSGATGRPIAGMLERKPGVQYDPVDTGGPSAAAGGAPAPVASGGAPPPPPPPNSLPAGYKATPADRDALARMMVTEAASEGDNGMNAVGQVAVNRLAQKYGGATSIAGVVNAPGQFEGMKNAASVSGPAYQRAQTIAGQILSGQMPDPTGGAVQYLNPDLQTKLGRAQPAWADGSGQRIGNHVFYGGNGGGNNVGNDNLEGSPGSDVVAAAMPALPGFRQGAPATPQWTPDGKGSLINANGDRKKDPSFKEEDQAADPKIVKALIDGRIAPPTQKAAATPYWQAQLSAATEQDPTFDGINFQSRAKTRAAFTSGKSADNITALNTVVGHLDRLDGSIDALGNTGGFPGSQWNNQAAHAIARNSGTDQRLATFDAYKTAVANELTRVFRGTGGAEADIQGYLRQLDDAASPQTLHTTVRSIAGLINSRLEAVSESYNQGMGTTKDPMEFLHPREAAAFARMSGLGAPQQSTAAPHAAAGWGKVMVH
jgi:hypothetical protein